MLLIYDVNKNNYRWSWPLLKLKTGCAEAGEEEGREREGREREGWGRKRTGRQESNKNMYAARKDKITEWKQNILVIFINANKNFCSFLTGRKKTFICHHYVLI